MTRLTGATSAGLACWLALLAFPGSAAAQGFPTGATCVRCHINLDDDRLANPARTFPDDIHSQAGFSCLDCHGPNAAGGGDPDPTAGFLTAPDRRKVPQMCGRCHSDARYMRNFNPSLRVDQEAEYATSVHGVRLAQFGDPNVAVCTSCHPAHQIRPPSDPQSSVYPLNVATTCAHCHADRVLMSTYGIPTDQRDEYYRSVHWQWMVDQEDLSAPTCNDCHGNHGAAPPGISSVRNVCGQCHSVMAGFFTDGGHAGRFTASDLPGCATCHGNHVINHPDDNSLLVYADSVCGLCHAPDAPERSNFPMMKAGIDSLIASQAHSRAVLDQAANLGMEVSQAQFTLEDVKTALVKARAAIHTFDADSVQAEVNTGLATANRAAARGQEALDEHLFRRQGLAVSVALILLLVLGLALKIRQLERSGPQVGGETG